MKVCSKCKKLKHDIEFTKGQNYCIECKKLYRHNYTIQNQKRLNENSRVWRAKEKLEVLKHYYPNGDYPVCVRCGFSDIRALSIDHILGGGTAQKEDYKVGGNHFYTWLRKQRYPSGYQVLCMNCQFIKRHEKEEWANV